MLHQKPRPASYADIEALPEHECGEIVRGVLHVHRYPWWISCAATALIKVLRKFDVSRSGGYRMLRRPEVHLGEHVLVADIAAWSSQRLSCLPESHIQIPPNWVAELIQPETAKLDRTDKLTVYAEFGVGHCWYVDPVARTLEVFALTGGKFLLAAMFRDADPVTAPPFEVHTFPLDLLWVMD